MPESDFALEVVDLDVVGESNPALLATYDELVPALVSVAADGAVHRVCHHFFDVGAVRAFLSGPRV